jgi:hypothetical protein
LRVLRPAPSLGPLDPQAIPPSSQLEDIQFMTNPKSCRAAADLKTTLAVLGASLGVAMTPVAVAAPDASKTSVQAEQSPATVKQQKVRVTEVPMDQRGTAKGGADKASSINYATPADATQKKAEITKSAPQGADQKKANTRALESFSTPQGSQQNKLKSGRAKPEGAQQLKINSNAAAVEGNTMAPMGAQQSKH